MTNSEKYGLNDCGVFTKFEVAEKHGAYVEMSAILVAQDDEGKWHYGLQAIDGGHYPSLQGASFDDKQSCINAAREQLIRTLLNTLRWYKQGVEVASAGATDYRLKAELYKKHINAIKQQSLF